MRVKNGIFMILNDCVLDLFHPAIAILKFTITVCYAYERICELSHAI